MITFQAEEAWWVRLRTAAVLSSTSRSALVTFLIGRVQRLLLAVGLYEITSFLVVSDTLQLVFEIAAVRSRFHFPFVSSPA
jgi:hypothetical protein